MGIMLGALSYLSPFGVAGMAITALFVAQGHITEQAAEPSASFARPAAAFSDAKEATPDSVGGGVEIERSRDGMFYVNAEINGERVRFLVDSGASVAVLTQEDARRLGLQAQPHDGRLDTVGGAVPMSWTTLKHMKIGDRRLHFVRAAVVEGGPGVSLIGQNVLTQFSSIVIKGDHMRLD